MFLSRKDGFEVYVVHNFNRTKTNYPIKGNPLMFSKTNPSKPKDIITRLKTGDSVKIISISKFEVNVLNNIAPGIRRQTCAKVRYGGREGYINIASIGKPVLPPDYYERKTIKLTQQMVNQLKTIAQVGTSEKVGINIEIEGIGLLENISKVQKVTKRINNREAKADIVLKDINNNPILYISHKKPGGAKSFSQYGGITKSAGSLSNQNIIYEDPEVQRYLNDLYTLYEDAISGNKSYPGNPFNSKGDMSVSRIYRNIQNPILIARSVYGPDYGGPFGIDNVNLIAQGDFIFKPYVDSDGDINFKLRFSERYEINGDLEDFTSMGSRYRAVIVTRIQNGDSTQTPRGKIPNVRTTINNVSFLTGTSENIDVILTQLQSIIK